MNKSLRALIAVIVLPFAAAGMYYAWFKPANPSLEKLDVRKRTGSKVEEDPTFPLAKVTVNSSGSEQSFPPSLIPANTSQSEVANVPTAAQATTTAPTIPPGFTVDTSQLQPLPANLPGFNPVTATGAVVGARAAQTPSSNSMGAAPTVGQPGTVSSAPTSRSQSPSATSPSSAPNGSVVPIVKFVPSTPATPATPATPTTTATKTSVASPSAATVHVVVEGDTLTSIAKQYWGTSQGWENIVKANPGLTPTNLKIGAKLNIPAKDSPIVKTVATSTASGTTVAGGGQEYEVVSGDTLSQISNKVYGDSKHWNLIYEANKKSIGEDPAALVVGTKLTIPAKPGSSAKPTSNATTTSATKSTVTPTPSNSPNTKSSTTPTSAPTPTPPIGSPTKPL